MKRGVFSCCCVAFVMCCVIAFMTGRGSAFACLAEYRSPDWEAAHAPVIFIGTVEKVEDAKPEELDAQGFLHGLLGGGKDEPKPTVATVKITRMIKGNLDVKTIKVYSGPLASCAPYDVHYTFTAGKSYVFCPDHLDAKGNAQMAGYGRMHSLSDVELIESCWNRAQVFQKAFIDAARKEHPEEFKKAQALLTAVAKQSKTWPDYPNLLRKEGEKPDAEAEKAALEKYDKELDDAVDKLTKTIGDASLETLRICMSLDWLTNTARPGHSIWTRFTQNLENGKPNDFAEYEQARITKDLQALGFDAKQIKTYLAHFEVRDFRSPFGFPAEPPSPWGNKEWEGDSLTTDFIYRYTSYDRGAMFPAYGMSWEVLAKLDPQKVKNVIEEMYASRDEQLRLVAYRAIERIPGTEFVDLIISRMYDDPFAWQALVAEKDQAETDKRLGALIQKVMQEPEWYWTISLWGVLKRGQCFETVCLDKAVDLLEQEEKGKLIRDKQEIESLKGSLRSYLNAALNHFSQQKMAPKDAAEYRAAIAKALETMRAAEKAEGE